MATVRGFYVEAAETLTSADSKIAWTIEGVVDVKPRDRRPFDTVSRHVDNMLGAGRFKIRVARAHSRPGDFNAEITAR